MPGRQPSLNRLSVSSILNHVKESKDDRQAESRLCLRKGGRMANTQEKIGARHAI